MIKIVKLPNSKLRNPQNLWNMDVYKYVMKIKDNLFVINLHDNLHHPQITNQWPLEVECSQGLEISANGSENVTIYQAKWVCLQ